MKMYKLAVSLTLLEIADPQDAPAEPETKFLDSAERAEDLQFRAIKMLENVTSGNPIFGSAIPNAPANQFRVLRTFDVPVKDFSAAMDVLKQFDDLGNKVGIPSSEALPPCPVVLHP